MPNHVINELIFRDLDTGGQNVVVNVCTNTNGLVDFEVLVPIPQNVWRWSETILHDQAFGESGCSMKWCRENWGTKWNAYDHHPIERDDTSIVFRFKTAWNPPYRWLVAVFNTTKLSFEHNWMTEGDVDKAICGKWNYPDGDVGYAFPWGETRGDETMRKHLLTLLYGAEAAEEIGGF